MRYFLLALFSSLVFFSASGQINHVEPLNWWVGMKNPRLQLLVNGSGIGETTPVINHPGVKIQKVTPGESKNHLFIDLIIDKTTKPGTMNIEFKKGTSVIQTYPYVLQKREQDAAAFRGFNSSDAIYLIVPDRFANGDSTNDVVGKLKENKTDRNFPGGRHGGDIRGIIDHLDYIHDLGFTAIWPTPLLENDMEKYSYHGYSITNHYQVDPRFGTLKDYKELSAALRKRGMKLIFDEVLNHTGSNYWWMQDLPFSNWLNFAPPQPYTGTNHKRTVNQDPYASAYDKTLWSKGWFDITMPDMNGENTFVASYLIQNTIWWIETLQLGGVRQDTYGYSDKTFLTNWSCAIMQEYPNFSIVGEEWSTNPLITSYWQEGKKNHDGYTGCLNTIMDFPLQAALVQSLNGEEGESYHAPFTKLYEALANDFIYPNPNQILLLGDNHDMDRLYMQLKQDASLVKMALAYLGTIRGIPQFFYGTEILLDNTPHHKNDGLIRADFPGGWAGDQVNGFTGKGLTASQTDVQQFTQKLLQWRKKNPVIAKGKTLHFAPFDGIYVYFRYDQSKTVMVVLNLNPKAVNLNADRFKEILQNKGVARDVISGQSVDLKSGIPVGARSAAIFEVN